jgi:hypothetical protein
MINKKVKRMAVRDKNKTKAYGTICFQLLRISE